LVAVFEVNHPLADRPARGFLPNDVDVILGEPNDVLIVHGEFVVVVARQQRDGYVLARRTKLLEELRIPLT
jgi:hypothetical protein